jgi:prephenate dehydrogenase
VARPRVSIVGLGLIGGSLAMALRRAGYTVVGFDRPRVRARARAKGAVHVAASSLSEAAEAEVVILAAPPVANLQLLRRLARRLPADAVVTDVGSVKVPICREARRLGLATFVGGHPMAGNEGSGFAAADAGLFKGRPWVLATDGASRDALRKVTALARAVEARPTRMRARVHDRTVAFLSHLPQLAAWALLEAAQRDRVVRRHLAAAGPGFRDMTRLARSPRLLWREILGQNHAEVRRALAAFRRALSRSV